MSPAAASRVRTPVPAAVNDGSNGGSKLARRVARRILADVVERGWQVGEVLGSEPELVERYGVSRDVFREAVRIVENQQVAIMRRGPGGGLVVSEPTVGAIIDAAVLYLYRVNAHLAEVVEARVILEEIVAELAPTRLDEPDVARVRAHMDGEASGEVKDHRALHALLASITKNPALELFVDILNRVMLLYFRGGSSLSPTTLEASQRAHVQIALAVIGGDSGLARHRMRTHLLAESKFLAERNVTDLLLPDTVALDGAATAKRAEDVARAITHEVVAGDLPPGYLLGSQNELVERFGVSRAVFREAVRLLEHHHVAAMRRGPGGGLFVTAPSVDAVSDVVAVYLTRRGMALGDLVELRAGVELALADLASRRMDNEGLARLREAARREQELPVSAFAEGGHDLHVVIAQLAHNRALELVALVLIQLFRQHLAQVEVAPAAARARAAGEVTKVHGAIVEALAAGDRELALHRLRRHLEALGRHLH
ncbi:MAG TPA: FCD domain-containing protein [Acidimicrobiales bacterium]|nr:FCD domain-containing protein [Acidimicrobiales bacterium]